MNIDQQLKDKVILIHGGTSGIGKALVIESIAQGAFVIFSGRDKEKANIVLKELADVHGNEETSKKAVYFQADVRDYDKQHEIYNVLEGEFKRPLDIMIYVAGTTDLENLMNYEDGRGSYATIDINLTSAITANFIATEYFIKNERKGCIILTSSLYGSVGGPTNPLYSATKHALNGLVKSCGSKHRNTNDIRFNSVAPHFVDTDMTSRVVKLIEPYGIVPMKECISTYIDVILNEDYNGDVIHISPFGVKVEERFPDENYVLLEKTTRPIVDLFAQQDVKKVLAKKKTQAATNTHEDDE